MKRKEVVIFLLKKEDNVTKVLLGLKAKKLGDGKRNGYGGGIKKNESLREAALRELKQELGVEAESSDLNEQGFLDILIRTGIWKTERHLLHIFTLSNWRNEFTEGNGELTDPQWFNIDQLPTNLIDSDRAWLPYILHGHKVQGSITVRILGDKITTFIFDVIH